MKRLLILLAVVVVALLLVAGGGIGLGTMALNKDYNAPVHPFVVAVPDMTVGEAAYSAEAGDDVADVPDEVRATSGPDAEAMALAEGQRLADAYGCSHCHGGNLAGTDFIEGMPFMNLPAPGLTGGAFTPEQFELAVRHGVGADGRNLVIMPAKAYVNMADDDLSLIYNYAGSLPAGGELIKRSIGPIGRIVALADGDQLIAPKGAVQKDVHLARRPDDLGGYYATVCSACHGDDLGGKVETIEGVKTWSPNLTRDATGQGEDWTYGEFVTAIREGRNRAGAEMDPLFMPWRNLAALTDDELEAIWDYLRSVPSVERTNPRAE